MKFRFKYYSAYILSLIIPKKKNHSFILMYHQITKDFDENIFSVSIQNFELHIFKLKKLFKLTDLYDLNIYDNSFAITFDDGYEDIYKLIYPVIKKLNIRITIFLTYKNLNKKNYLKDFQIKEMLQSGLIELGCHGNSHISQKKLNDRELLYEIEIPKKKLENLFNINISFLSFPNGIYDYKTIEFCKRCKFKKTFDSNLKTVTRDYINTSYTLPRICVYNIDNLSIILSKVYGKFNFLNINPNE